MSAVKEEVPKPALEPVTVTLSKPVEWHNKTYSELTIKPPSTGLYLKLGEPRIVVHITGGGYYIEKDDVIRNYIEGMVVHEGGGMFVEQLPLIDGKNIRNAVLGFFDRADTLISRQRSAPSSSTSGS